MNIRIHQIVFAVFLLTAQYIICNPVSVGKMQPNSSGVNPKIQRNFEVFSPCELTFVLLTPAYSCRLSPFGRLIARVTQHIPDKSFQIQTPGQRPGGPKAISYQALSDGAGLAKEAE